MLVARLRTALSDHDDPELVDPLLMAYSGAMTITGTGTMGLPAVVRSMEKAARQIDPAR
ncbi:hypothetical protein BH10ACT1_BH10ACT1_41440 [soil metagenome]